MKSDLFQLSVIIPCLNESQTLERCILKAQKALKTNDIIGEIIVADNGSTDGSQEIAKRLGARVVHVPEKGYGAALMGGISASQGEFIVMGDADDSYDFFNIQPFIEKLREGYDLVMGCRFPKGGGKIMPGAMPWKHRWIGNPLLSGMGRFFFNSPVTDFHCGLRAFRRATYDQMDLKSQGMEFASEMVIKATLKGMKIIEVPITLYKDGRNRSSHLRSWRDGWRHLRFMLLFTPRWLFLIPGFSLFVLGLILGGLLLGGDIQIGSLHFGLNSLVVATMATLVGFQLITFALFTKVFATVEGFLPKDPRIEKIFNRIKLETGILFGIFITLVGIGLLIGSILFWEHYNFGPMPPTKSLRIVIPAVTFITLGIQIIFSSFFLSILGLRRK